MDEHYSIEQLTLYVKFQLENGYDLQDIQDALLQHGYKKELVSKIIRQFKDAEKNDKQTINKVSDQFFDKLAKRDKEVMQQDMALYIENMLVDYIKKQQQLGFSFAAIKKALARMGHSQRIIESAIQKIKKGEYVDNQQLQQIKNYPVALLFFLCLIVIITVIFMLSVITDENLLVVFASFAPTFLGLVVLYLFVAYITSRFVLQITPVAILLVVLGIFFYLYSATTLYTNTDVYVVLGLNIILSFIASSAMVLFSKQREENFRKEHSRGEHTGEHTTESTEKSNKYTILNETTLLDEDTTAEKHKQHTHKIKEALATESAVSENKHVATTEKQPQTQKLKLKQFLP